MRSYLAMNRSFAWFAVILAAACQSTMPAAGPISRERIAAIVASPDRSDADRTNDRRRKPELMLAFIGVRPGMVAMDLAAAGGYTTELLARAAGPPGRGYGPSAAPPPPRRQPPRAPGAPRRPLGQGLWAERAARPESPQARRARRRRRARAGGTAANQRAAPRREDEESGGRKHRPGGAPVRGPGAARGGGERARPRDPDVQLPRPGLFRRRPRAHEPRRIRGVEARRDVRGGRPFRPRRHRHFRRRHAAPRRGSASAARNRGRRLQAGRGGSVPAKSCRSARSQHARPAHAEGRIRAEVRQALNQLRASSAIR